MTALVMVILDDLSKFLETLAETLKVLLGVHSGLVHVSKDLLNQVSLPLMM